MLVGFTLHMAAGLDFMLENLVKLKSFRHINSVAAIKTFSYFESFGLNLKSVH